MFCHFLLYVGLISENFILSGNVPVESILLHMYVSDTMKGLLIFKISNVSPSYPRDCLLFNSLIIFLGLFFKLHKTFLSSWAKLSFYVSLCCKCSVQIFWAPDPIYFPSCHLLVLLSALCLLITFV